MCGNTRWHPKLADITRLPKLTVSERMTEYKDLATMEANETKADNLAQTVIGSDEKQMQGYRDRLQIREVLETRIAREQVLEPKR